MDANAIAIGSSVRVVRRVSPSEGPLVRGRKVWTLLRYSKPHGYAVIDGHGETWHVHPEALQAVSAAPRPLHSFVASYGNRDYCGTCGETKDRHACVELCPRYRPSVYGDYAACHYCGFQEEHHP